MVVDHIVFTEKQLRVSTVSTVSLKTKFEVVTSTWGSNYVGEAYDFAEL